MRYTETPERPAQPPSRSAAGLTLAAGAALSLLMLTSPGVARAECQGHERPRWVVHQSLNLLLNPMGAEHNARFGLCVPLFESADPILSLNHFEAGVSTYLSPVYLVPGAYLQLAPVSFLVLRAEISGLLVWPIPLEGAGFYPRPNYEGSWDRDSLPIDRGGGTTGWSARLMAVLRGRVPLAPGLGILALDALWGDVNVFEGGDYWVDVRDDVIAASGDWVIANEGFVLLEATLPEGPHLRFGAYSALRAVPSSGYVGHQVGPVVMLAIPRPDTYVGSVGIFMRLGVYTHHRFRQGQAGVLLGASVDWDLGGL